MLIFSTSQEIRLWNSSRPVLKSKSSLIVENYSYITSVDYHYEKKKIFWMDQQYATIFSINYINNHAENKVTIKI